MTTKRNAKKKTTDEIQFNTDWKREEFLQHCEITLERIENANISWQELACIYDNHFHQTKQLDSVAKYLAERLRDIPVIHSVRARVKDPRNLVRKIVRKRSEDKFRDIRFSNYQNDITDLIGIRALHLYKENWLEIHNFVQQEWETTETPTAYIREGDNVLWTKSYEDNGCEVKPHPRKYRSIHYLINCPLSKSPCIAELQVRTLFEEAWSEIDHQINYPQTAPFQIVAYYLELFNRYAGSADEMGSLLQILVNDLKSREDNSNLITKERDKALSKVEELVSKLEIEESQKAELKEEVSKLRNSPRHSSDISSNATTWQNPLTIGASIFSAPLESSIHSGFYISPYENSWLLNNKCKTCGKERGAGELFNSGNCSNCWSKQSTLNFTFGSNNK